MKKKALAIGMFDGVHLGHQHLLQHLFSYGCPTEAITFSNHPLEVLHPAAAPLPLTPAQIKQPLLFASGIEESTMLPFTRELASLSYEEFLAPYAIAHLVIGEDAAIGRDRLGTPEALCLLGLKRGFQVHVLPKLQDGQEPISSSRIRTLIAQGDLAQAERLLGRPYCFLLSSAHVHSLLPPDGRYAVWAASPGGMIQTTLTIEGRTPRTLLEKPQLISFGPLNHTILEHVCHQISLAAL